MKLDKDKYHSYVEYNFKKWYKGTYSKIETDWTGIKNELMVTKEQMGQGGSDKSEAWDEHIHILYIR